MQEAINQLINKTFILDGLEHLCTNVKIVTGNAVIITNRRTYNMYPSEIADFIGSLKFVDPKDRSILSPATAGAPQLTPEAVLIKQSIVTNFNRNELISDALMAVFGNLSDSPSDETFKKAAAMVAASNAIVNVQTAQFKMLNTKF